MTIGLSLERGNGERVKEREGERDTEGHRERRGGKERASILGKV